MWIGSGSGKEGCGKKREGRDAVKKNMFSGRRILGISVILTRIHDLPI